MYKANKNMNHTIDLSNGFCIVYGITIKQIDVIFPSGQTEDIWSFINKAESL